MAVVRLKRAPGAPLGALSALGLDEGGELAAT
jgi:hypothetical protein